VPQAESTEITRPRFSMLRGSPGLLLIAIAVADMLRVASADLYGHIRFGQIFLNQGHLLPANPFGYSAPDYRWLVEVISDYVHFQDGDHDAPRVLNSYPHDYVLISPDLPAHHLMVDQPGWILVYQDSDAWLFARADSNAAKIPGGPIRGAAPSHEFP